MNLIRIAHVAHQRDCFAAFFADHIDGLLAHRRVNIQHADFRTFSGNISVHDGILLGLKLKLPVAVIKQTVDVQGEPAAVMGTTTMGLVAMTNSSTIPISASGGSRMPMRP